VSHNDDESGLMPLSEYRAMERALVQLEDADLGEWDREFIDDIGRRFLKFERRTRMSGAQQKQFDRIKEQYL